ncbi:hypothetical protein GCM10011608_58770 [Micromonospora sonchi]|uniref:Uncharacterized protein n=1 Tax=Micromonospora sonchi TaxID=1763543 RepID=A0A917U8E1_9ACTN|nr:hypothetical protein [Micromonospora sonchi]GGM65756.1 hypothetical protein GCM10011608_58770 [Micromonospora sonchi]
MNAFDLSPAQIRNRLLLRARQAALAARSGLPCVGECPVGAVLAAVVRVPVVPQVAVAAGDVVRLGPSDHRQGVRALRLRVVRVRADISQWYGGQWVWLEGVEIGPDGEEGAWRPVLARVAALPSPPA